MEASFNPNVATFKDGLERIEEAKRITKFSVKKEIITSQDHGVADVCNLLATSNVPKGFKKWQLPFSMDKAQFFMSVGSPDADVAEHSHDEGAGIRFIISGSIFYKDKELKAGDWMYIPQGASYRIRVGSMGASMCYCYECCCAPRILWNGDRVINPNPYKG